MTQFARRFIGSVVMASLFAASVPAAALPPPPPPAPAPAGSGSGSAAPTPPPPPAPVAANAADLQKKIEAIRAEVQGLRKLCSEGCKKGADDKPVAPPPPPVNQVCDGGPQAGVCEERKAPAGNTKVACLIPGSAPVKLARDTKRNVDVYACAAPSTVVPRVAAVENTVTGVVNAMLGKIAADKKSLEEKLVAFDTKAKELGIGQPSEREAMVGVIGALRLLELDVKAMGDAVYGEGQPFSMIMIDGRPVPLKGAIEIILGRYNGLQGEIATLRNELLAFKQEVRDDLASRNRLTLGVKGLAALRARGENLLGVLATFGGVTTWGGYAQLAAGGGLGGGQLHGTVIVGEAEAGMLFGDPRGAQFGAGGFGRMAKGVSTFSNGGVDAGLGLRGLIPVGDGGTRVLLGVQGYQSFADCYGSGAPGCSGLGLGLTLGVDSGHAPTGKTSGSNASSR